MDIAVWLRAFKDDDIKGIYQLLLEGGGLNPRFLAMRVDVDPA